ncbi:MAG: sulfatase-like hydrolase/transferase [Candidatus Hinthialibacter antarcticus]|nr:sulfatase-like hydrolase/transferase [Candidatus Hinthialibacter antarcticus]
MVSSRRSFIKSFTIGAAITTTSKTTKAATGLPSQAKAPNILLLFPDQHRFDWLGSSTHLPVRTPNIDRLAANGVQFKNAICPSPLCAPSRACLASGNEYDRCRVPNNGANYPLDQPTFYHALHEAGYHVLGCGKLDLHKASQTWGLDGRTNLHDWGFDDGIDNAGKWDAINSGREVPKDPYMAFLHDHGLAQTHVDDFMKRRKEGKNATFATPLPEPAYCDNWIGQNGLFLLRRAPQNQPWFLQVNFTGPHDPVDITHSMSRLYEGVEFPQPNQNTQLEPEKHVEIRRNYSAMVENIDRWVGVYLNELERRGELDNTLVVFSSDHGEMLGDHNLWAKTHPYQPSVGVPLVISGPGVVDSKPNIKPVTTLDLAATFLECAGAKIPARIDSQSLWPILNGKTDKTRDFVLSGLGPWRMVDDGRFKLVVNYGKQQQTLLFDRTSDPLENNNLAKSGPAEVKRLKKLLPM